jgi:hypothetical protein
LVDWETMEYLRLVDYELSDLLLPLDVSDPRRGRKNQSGLAAAGPDRPQPDAGGPDAVAARPESCAMAAAACRR